MNPSEYVRICRSGPYDGAIGTCLEPCWLPAGAWVTPAHVVDLGYGPLNPAIPDRGLQIVPLAEAPAAGANLL